ncbi:PHD finger protein 24-like [Rhinoraja longicauda]
MARAPERRQRWWLGLRGGAAAMMETPGVWSGGRGDGGGSGAAAAVMAGAPWWSGGHDGDARANQALDKDLHLKKAASIIEDQQRPGHALNSLLHQTQNSCLTSDDFLHYKHGVHQRQCGGPLAEGQEGGELAQYRALTPTETGLDWPDFLYHESLLLLDRLRSRNSLLRLLTAKERERARGVFLSLERSPQDLVSAADCRRAQHTWFIKPAEEVQSCSVSISHVGPMSEKSPGSRGRGRAQDRTLLSKEPEDSRPVPWETFLKENVIYILAARPNSAATHLLPTV